MKTDVVTREEAERRGAVSVADALATQPGLVVNPGNYGFLGGVSALQIQGFDRDRVLILEDGERVVGDVGGAIDLSAIPIGDVSRVEVVTGPASSLYGSAALGGVVNIITAPPRDYGASARARGEYRSLNGVVLQGNGAFKSETPLFGLRDPWAQVDANYTRMDGVEKTAGLPDTRIPETDRRMVGLRAGVRLSDRMDVRVRARLFRDRNDGVESRLAPGLGRFITDRPAETDRYTFHVIHQTRIGDASTLRLTVGRQQFDNFTAVDRRSSPIDERHDRTQRMQSIEAVATIPNGPLTWVAGTRFEAEHFSQTLTRTSSTADGPVTTTAPEVTPLAYGTAALYAQTTWKVGPLTLMPGFRTEVHTRYGASFTPRFAGSWQVSPRVTLRTSAGRGFRAPSAKELGFVFDHSVFGYRINGNPDLNPEKSWGVNADITVLPGRAADAALLRGSVFANWVEDLIDLDLGNGVFDGTVATYSYTNFGRARTAGGQLDARFKPAKWISAETSYAYTWTRDDTNERPLPGRPPHAVTSSLRLEPGWKLEFITRVRVTTSSFLDEEMRSPGYQTVDLRAGRALWPRSQLYVGALNVTDVRQDPGRIGDTRPPLGRVLYVGLRAELPWDQP
ncbi:MAG: TonB-dependent receptor [Labilithrix sp.]|nr:TonB-dependent receptor [Labilithrix sp.]MCW5812184.1 TonB-dependent receptor [Labilithrix sp.]